MTIEESYGLLEQQQETMTVVEATTRQVQLKIEETKSDIRANKQGVDLLTKSKRKMQREMDDRDAKGNRDERAEEGCRWYVLLNLGTAWQTVFLTHTADPTALPSLAAPQDHQRHRALLLAAGHPLRLRCRHTARGDDHRVRRALWCLRG